MTRQLDMEPVTSSNWRELVQRCKVEDGHPVPPGATHLFRRQGHIVSAISLFTPVCMFWAHSRELNARDSLEHLQRCKQLAVAEDPNFLIACSGESPYRPFLENHFGFRFLFASDVLDLPAVHQANFGVAR